MREKLNCPNCGMPITGATCEYCGTVFYDFANVELNKAGYLRMRVEKTLNIFKAIPESITIEDVAKESMLYMENSAVTMCVSPEYIVTLQLRVVPDDNGVLVERYREEWGVKK